MNRAAALLLAAFALLLPQAAAHAQGNAGRVVSVTRWVEEWDPASQQWVRVADAPATLSRAAFDTGPARTTAVSRSGNTVVTQTVYEPEARLIPAARRPLPSAGVARFGPFAVLGPTRAALVGATDAASPQAFARMLAAYPDLAVIEFLDAPGTSHDLANLKLGRAIRRAGLATHVPAGGSARSGAVELFLAGTRRTVDPAALFAVHAWRDELGREPTDFAPDAPENRLYLDYYAEMGMSAEQARAFYAMTNSVPHAGALWLRGSEMARWIVPQAADTPRIAAGRTLAPLLEPEVEHAMRAAVARSGEAVAGALRPAFRRPAPAIIDPFAVPAPAPRLAYAAALTGLLDSGAAFP